MTLSIHRSIVLLPRNSQHEKTSNTVQCKNFKYDICGYRFATSQGPAFSTDRRGDNKVHKRAQ